MKKRILLLTMALLALVVGKTMAEVVITPDTNGIIYVTADGTGDGSSWNAAADLSKALAGAVSGNEIWVAEGTYVPQDKAATVYKEGGETTDRDKSFVIPAGVALYGGFTGTETQRGQRNWIKNETILSGNVNDINDAYDNSYHVVIIALQDDETATLDGFIITGGVGTAGYHITITVNTIEIEGNTGGGVFASGKARLVRNTIYDNSAGAGGWGGGVYAQNGVSLEHNIIYDNGTDGGAGGVYATGGVKLSYNKIYNNSVVMYGAGGVYAEKGTILKYNTIYGNKSQYIGGGVYANNATLSHNTIYGNSCFRELSGSGVYAANASTLTDNILWGNTSESGDDPAPQDLYVEGTDNSISHNLVGVIDGSEGEGNIIGEDPLFVNTDSETGSLDFHLQEGSPAVGMGIYVSLQLDENGRIYINEQVNTNVPTYTGDGSSWTNANTSLADALLAEGVKEIWVAAGTYKPYESRDAILTIFPSVAVYGGFNGTEDSRDQRDWVNNKTILSGNIGNPDDHTDNCKKVVNLTSGTRDNPTILDGFTITGGYSTENPGSGVYAAGHALVINNTITGNTATFGGGVFADGYVQLINNTITGNTANGEGGESDEAGKGGGVCAKGYSKVINNTITGNTATSNGGGVYVSNNVQVINNIIWGNTGDKELYARNFTSDFILTHNLIGSTHILPSDYPLDESNLIGDINPLFVNTDPDAGALDFSLSLGSPAINAGNNTAYLSTYPSTDILGNERIQGATIDIGAYECQADPAAEEPKDAIYHTLTLTVTDGITCDYATGSHTIAEDDHLFLTFFPEISGLTAEDILFLVDGVETTFTVSVDGKGGNYLLSPIEKDLTILVALREYPVILPEIEGLTITATEKAVYGQPFTFTLSSETLDLSAMKVFVNGEELTANALRAESYTYTIAKVEGPITITVEGTNPTSNGDIAEGDIQLRITNYELRIENTRSDAVDLAIYSITGRSVMQVRALRGSKTITLPAGVYIVRAGQQTWKIFING